MSLEAAITLCQVLPALLVAGLLGPLLVLHNPGRAERIYFASQVVFVVFIEGVLLFYVQRGQRVPEPWGGLTQLAVVYSLVGIAVVIVTWAINRRPPETPRSTTAHQPKSPRPKGGKRRR